MALGAGHAMLASAGRQLVSDTAERQHQFTAVLVLRAPRVHNQPTVPAISQAHGCACGSWRCGCQVDAAHGQRLHGEGASQHHLAATVTDSPSRGRAARPGGSCPRSCARSWLEARRPCRWLSRQVRGNAAARTALSRDVQCRQCPCNGRCSQHRDGLASARRWGMPQRRRSCARG